MPLLFISHASQDDDYVDRLIEHLTEKGIHTWTDHHNIEPGANSTQEIEQAMFDCDMSLLVWSNNAAKSEEVRSECRRLKSEGKTVFIIIIETIKPENIRGKVEHGLPYFLTETFFIDLRHADVAGCFKFFKELEKLITAMKTKATPN